MKSHRKEKPDVDAEFLKELRSLREGSSKFDGDKYFCLSFFHWWRNYPLKQTWCFVLKHSKT
jgi:hypothetical protein